MILGNLRAGSLAVRVQMCSACRYLEAYWNGRLLKRMSLASATARIVTVGLATFPGVQSGTLTLVVRTPAVVVDAVAASQA